MLCSTVSLPGKNINCFLNLCSFIMGLSLFSLNFLFLVKHPKLSVNLLLNNGLFNFTLFVHKLLFSFNLASSNHEISFFFSKLICLHFELSIKSMLDKCLPLVFTLVLQSSQSFGHFGSDLLWGLKGSKEFLLIDFIFVSKKSSESASTGKEICFVSSLHIGHSRPNCVLHDVSICFVLPIGFQMNISISSNRVVENGFFLFVMKNRM